MITSQEMMTGDVSVIVALMTALDMMTVIDMSDMMTVTNLSDMISQWCVTTASTSTSVLARRF